MKRFYQLLIWFLFICLPYSAYATVTFEIKGVQDNKTKDNILIFLKNLTLPENANNENYLADVEETAKESVIALGYYHTEFTTTVTGTENSQIVTLDVTLGTRTQIIDVDLRLTGEALKDANFQQLMLTLPIKKGDFLDHGVYESAKGDFSRLAQRNGYFDAKYLKSVVDVSEQTNTAVVHLWFDSGIRYQFGDLIFVSEIPADKFVRSLINFKKGDPFENTVLNEFNQSLSETGFFKSITILPEISQKKGRFIPLHVIASMRPEDTFNVGVGYSTDEGVRGSLGWTRPWINQYGHSIQASAIASIPSQQVSMTYKIPIADPLFNYFSIQSGYKKLDQNDTNTTQYLVSFNRHWKLDNEWLRTLYIRYDNESGIQGSEEFAAELILPGISFSRKRSRGDINIEWGDKQSIFFEFARQNLFSSSNVAKLYGQAKIIRTYNGHQFVGSSELGGIIADSIYDVPSSMRYFTGGDQTIRGYGYNEIAPTDSDDYLVGGYYLASASLEYRYPIVNNWKIAVFTDFGTATDDFSESLSIGSGTGVIWASPVGPVRLYLAFPLTETTGSSNNYTINFMIGPEL
ncbi:autotransporter assembly complex protein TamA [Psychromonas sp.]|nr:autotransporter assembly complex protein TamA [Psychromonas sp.]